MNAIFVNFRLILFCIFLSMLLFGCNQNQTTQPPKLLDKDKVGCLITNDFYAVHFSAYLKPSSDMAEKHRDALLKPYCQELPAIGQTFFAADLIDRDIRKTPIGIRLVQLELIGKNESKPENYKEIKTITEVDAKLYPSGVIETQADIKSNGFYALYLIIGGEEAISEEDKLRIPFHVGGDPNKISTEIIIYITCGILALVLIVVYFIYRYRRKTGK